jgi:hypothetical protein
VEDQVTFSWISLCISQELDPASFSKNGTIHPATLEVGVFSLIFPIKIEQKMDPAFHAGFSLVKQKPPERSGGFRMFHILFMRR